MDDNKPKCKHCKSVFTPRNRGSAQQYCSRQCRFNHHYHRRMGTGPMPCTYCGLPASSQDHIPPQAYRKFLSETGDTRFPFHEVPACKECNSGLGAVHLWTVTARKRYVKLRLRRKYAKYLKIPNWTDEERAELGPGLLADLRSAEAIKHVTQQRLAW